MTMNEHLTRVGHAMTLTGLAALLSNIFGVGGTAMSIISGVVLILSLLLVYIGNLSNHLSAKSFLFILLAILISFSGFYFFERNERLDNQGTIEYYETASTIFYDLDGDISKAEDEIWFFGTNFFLTADEKRGLLLEAVRSGVKLKFLILNPNTDYYSLVAQTLAPEDPIDALKHECNKGIFNLLRLMEEAKGIIDSEGVNGSVEVRLMDIIPQNRLYILDPNSASGVEYFVPYINGLLSSQSPAYKIRTSSVTGKSHLKSVNIMWNGAIELSDWVRDNPIQTQ